MLVIKINNKEIDLELNFMKYKIGFKRGGRIGTQLFIKHLRIIKHSSDKRVHMI